MSRGIYSDIPI